MLLSSDHVAGVSGITWQVSAVCVVWCGVVEVVRAPVAGAQMIKFKVASVAAARESNEEVQASRSKMNEDRNPQIDAAIVLLFPPSLFLCELRVA